MKFSEKSNIPILLYHRIVKNRSDAGRHKIWVLEKNFRKQMQFLKNEGFKTLTLHDLDKIDPKDNSPKVILTFDDGYEDNYSIMFPVLKEFGLTAVIYLVTQIKTNAWGVAEGEPEKQMMTDAQILEMDKYGIEFGGHTQHHKDLKKISIQEAEKEISGCKTDIEKIINKTVISFAFPFGAINDELKAITKNAEYKYAVSTNTGPDNLPDDLFHIKRIEVTPKTSISSFQKKVSGDYFKKKSFFSIFSQH